MNGQNINKKIIRIYQEKALVVIMKKKISLLAVKEYLLLSDVYRIYNYIRLYLRRIFHHLQSNTNIEIDIQFNDTF